MNRRTAIMITRTMVTDSFLRGRLERDDMDKINEMLDADKGARSAGGGGGCGRPARARGARVGGEGVAGPTRARGAWVGVAGVADPKSPQGESPKGAVPEGDDEPDAPQWAGVLKISASIASLFCMGFLLGMIIWLVLW